VGSTGKLCSTSQKKKVAITSKHISKTALHKTRNYSMELLPSFFFLSASNIQKAAKLQPTKLIT
jgi:hypothetical protein